MITEAEVLSIYRGTVQSLYAFVAHRAGGQRELAEDTVQETYMRAVVDWRKKGTPRVPLAWLKTVARNLLISQYRRIRPESLNLTVIDLEDDSWNPEQRDEAAVLYHGLAQLKASQSRLLEAFYFDGQTLREIAADLDISERAVEGRMRRARHKLRARLRRLMPNEGSST